MKSRKLYSQKNFLKIIIAILAILIIGISLWYSNYIVQQIKKEEEIKVKLWSEAIKKQAQLLQITKNAFITIEAEEKRKMQLWANATKELGGEYIDYSFVMSIVSSEDNIPKIIELQFFNGKEFKILFQGINLDKTEKNFKNIHDYQDYLQKLSSEYDKLNQVIRVPNTDNQSQLIHYGNSKLLQELKNKSNQIEISFKNDLVNNSALVPIIFVDKKSRKIIATNLRNAEYENQTWVDRTIKKMLKENNKIEVETKNNQIGEIYYFESYTLKQLRFFPIIQLTIIIFFSFITYLLFSTFRKAEQNKVWAGMAKETAHQLGTPIFSLVAWVELLKTENIDQNIPIEIEKDIKKLEIVTNRFSKIGSEIPLKVIDIEQHMINFIEYIKPRISKNIELRLENIIGDEKIEGMANKDLLDWVIENITKNSVDAIEHKNGIIEYIISKNEKYIFIDIVDNGKGIHYKNMKSIFKPGFTTKTRGWGLGLSLVKRIVEDQLNGKISILNSELGKGTTFRIKLIKKN